ncbi:MFS transporter [Pseudomonas sp. MAP12]|uniref:MFS transporter n=1 Tax=Geopseudomonas aromaticivorans TaxID=2849492 RepID=A0ABS6MTU8_9GAMM|nr:MFS transporter [Pseudomonas aromaticivorans]MBV2131970.1 MFS transporter [Pseudomonas aromaticivorans]
MDALLIVGGLLLILFGMVWLVVQAFSTSLLWGVGSLLPPLPLLFIVRHWQRARSSVTLMGMGCIPLVVGLTLLASHDADRLAAILSLRWLEPEAKVARELDIQLRGEFNGKPFAPELGELIDGTLILREGDDFFARRELSIRLPSQPSGDLQLNVLPDDRDNLPAIELSWLLPDHDLPETRRVISGYTLHLDLKSAEPNLLRGDFHLVLPSGYRTSLSGKVELYTSDLRYRNGRVDTRHNSQATLEWLIVDYLQRNTRTRAVELAPLPPMDLDSHQLDLDVEARIAGVARRMPLTLVRSDLQGWRVQGDQAPALPPPSEDDLLRTAPVPTTVVRGEERPLDRRIGFSLESLLDRPGRYLGARVRVMTERGRSAEGRFDGINAEGRLVIQHALGGQGEASFLLRSSEVTQIELLEP